MKEDICSAQTFDPAYMPADPAAEALDLFVQLPLIAGCEPGSETVAAFQDLAGMMQVEGVLDGLDWHDARHMIGAVGFDVWHHEPAQLLTRAGLMRAEVRNGGPLHEPVRVAEAVERVYDLLVQTIAGPMPAEGQL